MKQSWIRRPEGGGYLGLISIFFIARLCGRTIARLILYPVVLYFLCRRGPERRASRAYLSRLLGRRAYWLHVAQHFHTFAAITLDRVYLLGEQFKRFDVRCRGLEHLHAAMALNRGVLLFGAHVGSFDALRALSLQREDVCFRAVIDTEQNPSLSKILNALNRNLAATIINARRDGTQTALDIKDALEQRGIVTMLVDRARPGNRVSTLQFLGAPAPFPNEPWLLAAALKVPVVLCFALYRGGNRYELHFEPFAEQLNIPRQSRQTALPVIMQRFADLLASFVRAAPYNWFNFYDFWQPQVSLDDVDARDRDARLFDKRVVGGD